jgi:hypothetical protein
MRRFPAGFSFNSRDGHGAAKQVFHETFLFARREKKVILILLESCFSLNTSRPTGEIFFWSVQPPKDL